MRSLLSTFVGIGLAASVLLLTGCSRKKTEAVAPPIVTVATPVIKEVTDYEDFTGRTAPVETVEVRARVFGYLKEIKFKEGDIVKKGDLLYVIDPSTYQADLNQSQAQVRLADAQVVFEEANYSRISGLYKGGTGAVSKQDLDDATRSLEVAQARLKAAQADRVRKQLDLDFCQIYAEISGRIRRTQFTVGNLIQGGQGSSTLLTSIVAVNPMYAYFDIDERTMLRIQKLIREGKFRGVRDRERDVVTAVTNTALLMADAQSGALASAVAYVDRTTVVVPIRMKLATDEGYPYEGFVNFVNNVVTPTTGTITVCAIFNNDKGIFTPGLFVRVRVSVGGAHSAILVSERAISTNQGEKFVYVVNEKNEVVYKPVELGQLQDGLREIVTGVSSTDRVIVNGLLRVRPGVVVDPKTAEMLPSRGFEGGQQPGPERKPTDK